MLELAGRLHPLAVHLPIGILMLAVVFEWLSADGEFKYGSRRLYRLLSVFVLVMIILTAHLGSSTTHGADYLKVSGPSSTK